MVVGRTRGGRRLGWCAGARKLEAFQADCGCRCAGRAARVWLPRLEAAVRHAPSAHLLFAMDMPRAAAGESGAREAQRVHPISVRLAVIVDEERGVAMTAHATSRKCRRAALHHRATPLFYLRHRNPRRAAGRPWCAHAVFWGAHVAMTRKYSPDLLAVAQRRSDSATLASQQRAGHRNRRSGRRARALVLR